MSRITSDAKTRTKHLYLRCAQGICCLDNPANWKNTKIYVQLHPKKQADNKHNCVFIITSRQAE